ncbi:hypothetical protein ACFL5V_10175 [Fibrobacterota bacterium]
MKNIPAGIAIFTVLCCFWSCVPVGVGPTPRQLRKDPELKNRDLRKMYPDSVLPRSHLIEFPYRNIKEIKLSWKVLAGLELKYLEIKELKKLILFNVRKYWQYRYPKQKIETIALENVSVQDAQVLVSAGYPLLLYSAYDIRHRRRPYSFEGFDICIGYRGITRPGDRRVSFKLNSGLRGYLDSKSMLTGSLLDVPRLKTSQVQVLQVVLLTPPGIELEDIYNILRKKYKALGITDFTLPVKESVQSIGSIR